MDPINLRVYQAGLAEAGSGGRTIDAAAAVRVGGGAAAAAPALHLSLGGGSEVEGLAIVLERGAVWQAGPRLLLARADEGTLRRWRQLLLQQQQQQQQQEAAGGTAPAASASGLQALALKCGSEGEARALAAACERAVEQATEQRPSGDAPGPSRGAPNAFDAKIDKTSSDMYFHYYGMLQHQQNMLQDVTRTGTYHAAILGNRPDFEGKVVMDVGAGSGILSLFAAQAGASRVYAVEASGMARFAAQLAAANPPFGNAVKVLHAKVEELSLPGDERVDVLVSEPMGTLLVNERMLETYLYARDRFLKPGGRMFPQIGRIHAAAFSDALLYAEVAQKAAFWQQPAFYGVDVTCLFGPAAEGYFAQVVVDAFDPSVLASGCATRVFDFATCTEAELADIELPLSLTVPAPTTVHGVASWFDVLFNGSATQRWLSTAPGLPTTHWFQLRCVLAQPIVVLAPNTPLLGSMRLVAHERQSYSVAVTLSGPPLHPGGPPQQASGRYDLKEPYYRQLTNWYAQQAQQAQQQQQAHVQVSVPQSSPAPPAQQQGGYGGHAAHGHPQQWQ